MITRSSLRHNKHVRIMTRSPLILNALSSQSTSHLLAKLTTSRETETLDCHIYHDDKWSIFCHSKFTQAGDCYFFYLRTCQPGCKFDVQVQVSRSRTFWLCRRNPRGRLMVAFDLDLSYSRGPLTLPPWAYPRNQVLSSSFLSYSQDHIARHDGRHWPDYSNKLHSDRDNTCASGLDGRFRGETNRRECDSYIWC